MSETALDWIVLKIVQRCNLNCTYCYVYNRGDDSWRHRPPIISEAVALMLAHRIAEHCAKYSLKTFVIELHGGEPLLFGRDRMQTLFDVLRENCRPVRLRFLLQTNGVLLDEEWVDLFDKNDVSFGISLDGPPELADNRRRFLNGKGSTQRVLNNIERLRRAGTAFDRHLGGLLCVVDPSIPGGELVRWFVGHGFSTFEFLLPDGNYANYPEGWSGAEPYRRFLLEAFEEWYSMGASAPSIRLFETMLMAFMGVIPSLDALGGDLTKLCVIESDGSIGISDVLRFCDRKYALDELNIFDHPLDLRAERYRVRELQRPCSHCQQCPHFVSCGGGYLPHRFDGQSFDNPSIYCPALYDLSARMLEVLQADLPRSLWRIERSPDVIATTTPPSASLASPIAGDNS